MKDTLNKQKGSVPKMENPPPPPKQKGLQGFTFEQAPCEKTDLQRVIALSDELQKKNVELEKQNVFNTDKLRAVSSEVLSLRAVIVQLCKERYGL